MSPFRILDCGSLFPLNLKSKTQIPKSVLSRGAGERHNRSSALANFLRHYREREIVAVAVGVAGLEVVAAAGEDRSVRQVAERAADVKFYLLSNAATPHRRRRRRSRRGLVFVDCRFWGKEGKMKGSTKSQKMDEPFSM